MKNVTNPFFSVIIPCFNSKATIGRLLKSIVAQNLPDDIEIILADDHSTESYDQEVAPFEDKLCIRKIQTDYNCCPGNTREKGVSTATGTWLVFADHDDEFLPGTFRRIKNQIELHNEKYLAWCNIYRADNTNEKFNNKMQKIDITIFSGLLHGKFFNRENLWIAYDLHFKKDMFTHEDTYMISKIRCLMNSIPFEPLYVNIFGYVWYNYSKSLSNTNGFRNFLEENFHYYVEGTSEVYREYYKNKLIDKNFAAYNLLKTILYEYWYMQMFLFKNPVNFVRSNLNVCRDDLIETKRLLEITNTDIFKFAGANNAKIWVTTMEECGKNFIPNFSLMEWLNMFDKDE